MNNKKLNIAIILPTIISKNGTAKQSLELANKLSEEGHHVSFFTFAYLKESSFQEFQSFKVYFCKDIKNSMIHKLIKNVSTLEKLYLYMALISISSFRNIFRGKRIDILNPHDWFSTWIVGGEYFQNIPIIANINDVPDRLSGNFLEKFKLKMDRKFFKSVANVIVLDNKNKEKVKKWLQTNDNKVLVIRSGVDIEKYKNFKEKFDMREHLDIPKSSFLIVCANLLAPNRRYEDVLFAMSRFKKKHKKRVHLIILSRLDFDKKYANYLQSVVKEKNLTKNVHFIDKFFTDEERMKYIKSCDLLIFPNYPQTWGLTVIEAMALGVPTIVSKGAGVSEVLSDGVNSMLYEAGNVGMLQYKLIQSLDNKTKLKLIAKNGQKYIFSTFSWENFSENIEKIMIQVTKNKN